jgi:hypothetical protein
VANYPQCMTFLTKQMNIQSRWDGARRAYSNRVECDTRFFYVGRAFFLDQLSDAHDEVDDASGRFLEHVYAERLNKVRLPVSDFPIAPRVFGLSGSLNIEYKPPKPPLLRGLVEAAKVLLLRNFTARPD